MKDRRDVCKCGHARDTHFEKTGPCLGVACNDCQRYRDPDEPDGPAELAPRPNHAGWCRCYACKQHIDAGTFTPTRHPADDEPDTLPSIPAVPIFTGWP